MRTEEEKKAAIEDKKAEVKADDELVEKLEKDLKEAEKAVEEDGKDGEDGVAQSYFEYLQKYLKSCHSQNI